MTIIDINDFGYMFSLKFQQEKIVCFQYLSDISRKILKMKKFVQIFSTFFLFYLRKENDKFHDFWEYTKKILQKTCLRQLENLLKLYTILVLAKKSL